MYSSAKGFSDHGISVKDSLELDLQSTNPSDGETTEVSFMESSANHWPKVFMIIL